VTSESDIKDDLYGDYPFLLYKHFFITRPNLSKFCKMMTNINTRSGLEREDSEKGDVLENLIINKLHVVTVSLITLLKSFRN
jgi:hypothetical protein